eukprot:NODE_220_length_12432_cov_0.484878.p9 type:complete len:105 gc:universal NODE_220_length_12432_cov_0.484878:4366-4680(+)
MILVVQIVQLSYYTRKMGETITKKTKNHQSKKVTFVKNAGNIDAALKEAAEEAKLQKQTKKQTEVANKINQNEENVSKLPDQIDVTDCKHEIIQSAPDRAISIY